MSTQVTWYVARSAGIVAWSLAAGAVIWGLALSSRALATKPRPAWLYDLHRFLGGAALIFTGVHVVAILADDFVHFSVVDVLIPFTGTWHPLAVAWGIVAFYLLLAVELTSLLRARIPKRLWRRVHFASFALFAAGTDHGLTAGTDAGTAAFRLAAIAACVVVGLLTAVRVARATRRRARPGVTGNPALTAEPQVLHSSL
jgi:predicted ferric reductase